MRVSDDYLRAYWLRPEVHPVEESGEAERALHAALMQAPQRTVSEDALLAIGDEDAIDNYRTVLRFRQRLIDAGTIEGAYLQLMREGNRDIPPLFIDQMVHVVLRNMLDGCEAPLQMRAAELFFREQKCTQQQSNLLLADLETVEMHASGNQFGSLGRLLVEAQTSLAAVELDVLDRDNAHLWWGRDSRHDTVISINEGRAPLLALCEVLVAWVQHFLGVQVRIQPQRKIEEQRWAWHVGLDVAASSLLNDLFAGEEVDAGRMRRLLALFKLEFVHPQEMRDEVAGRPVYLALCADEKDELRMKPQNLLLNLPLKQVN